MSTEATPSWCMRQQCAHRQGFIGVVEVGQVGDPGAVPGHLITVQQEAAKEQEHHDAQAANQIGHSH